jgi:hypothetical protein
MNKQIFIFFTRCSELNELCREDGLKVVKLLLQKHPQQSKTNNAQHKNNS